MISRFLPIVLFLGSIGIFFLYIDPTYDTIQERKAEEMRLDEALTKAQELQKIRDSLKDKRNSLSQEDLARLNKLLPDHIDNVRLIIDIDSIASRYGMTIDSLGLSTSNSAADKDTKKTQVQSVAAARGPSLESVELSFSTAASYGTFLRFLRDLEQSLRIVDVTKLDFKALDFDYYDFNVTIRTYWLR